MCVCEGERERLRSIPFSFLFLLFVFFFCGFDEQLIAEASHHHQTKTLSDDGDQAKCLQSIVCVIYSWISFIISFQMAGGR